MARDGSGNFPVMDDPNLDGQKFDETKIGGLVNTSAPSTPHGAGGDYGLVPPSPFERRVERIFAGPDSRVNG